MPHLLRDVVILNNDCIQEMLHHPNEPERFIHAFRTLQDALRMLRNDASLADMDVVKLRASGGIPDTESHSSCRDALPCTHRSESLPRHSALIPSGQNLSLPSPNHNQFESNPSTDVYYLYDRPLLIYHTYHDVNDAYDDTALDTMNFVCATLLFNLSLICHRYAMTQRDQSRSDLLHNARKLYNVLIELLIDIVTTNETTSSIATTTNTIVESNEEEEEEEEVAKGGDIILLLTLSYHCLGHLNFELGMFAESSECMMKLHSVFVSQCDFFESIWSIRFDAIIDEIKLNIVFWKMHVPSPVAIAA